MTIRMSNLERLTLAEMAEFVTTSWHVGWAAVGPDAVYGLIERVLEKQQYRRLSKGHRGVVKRFLAKITGMSPTDATDPALDGYAADRTQSGASAELPTLQRCRHRVWPGWTRRTRIYRGPAVRHLRAWVVFGDKKFQRLAGISASHIYNLRLARLEKRLSSGDR